MNETNLIKIRIKYKFIIIKIYLKLCTLVQSLCCYSNFYPIDCIYIDNDKYEKLIELLLKNNFGDYDIDMNNLRIFIYDNKDSIKRITVKTEKDYKIIENIIKETIPKEYQERMLDFVKNGRL